MSKTVFAAALFVLSVGGALTGTASPAAAYCTYNCDDGYHHYYHPPHVHHYHPPYGYNHNYAPQYGDAHEDYGYAHSGGQGYNNNGY